jgi:hypothetical protein
LTGFAAGTLFVEARSWPLHRSWSAYAGLDDRGQRAEAPHNSEGQRLRGFATSSGLVGPANRSSIFFALELGLVKLGNKSMSLCAFDHTLESELIHRQVSNLKTI